MKLFVCTTNKPVATEVTALTTPCAGCHGKNGASRNPAISTSGGISPLHQHNSDAIGAFRDKIRWCNGGIMYQLSSDISEHDAQRIGEYFAGKLLVRAKQSFNAELTMRGKTRHQRHFSKHHQQEGGSLAQTMPVS